MSRPALPGVVIIAGQHGDEPQGFVAGHAFGEWSVPVLMPGGPAAWGSRQLDGRDLNREWGPTGPLTPQLAALRPRFIVDIHGNRVEGEECYAYAHDDYLGLLAYSRMSTRPHPDIPTCAGSRETRDAVGALASLTVELPREWGEWAVLEWCRSLRWHIERALTVLDAIDLRRCS